MVQWNSYLKVGHTHPHTHNTVPQIEGDLFKHSTMYKPVSFLQW